MKIWSALTSVLCLLALLAVGGCGGGSSSSSDPAAPTKSTVKMSTQGTLPAGTQLAGINVVITLPAGVTVNTNADGTVANGVISVSGVAAQAGVSVVGPVLYTPATATTPGTLEFTIAANNFGIGEFATVVFNVASGSHPPTAANVTISPADQSLQPVTGLTVALSAT